jgi:hypothetical protein
MADTCSLAKERFVVADESADYSTTATGKQRELGFSEFG